MASANRPRREEGRRPLTFRTDCSLVGPSHEERCLVTDFHMLAIVPPPATVVAGSLACSVEGEVFGTVRTCNGIVAREGSGGLVAGHD